MSMPLYICVFAPPYIHLRFFFYTFYGYLETCLAGKARQEQKQTPMHGEEEKAEAAILAAFVHWPCATARAMMDK